MGRPTDWTPLDRSSDPVPGDPDAVERAGKHYQHVAAAIATAAARLREIAGAVHMVSKAVTELEGRAEDVADDIERAHRRYSGVGDALVAYAEPLRAAQASSARALANAVRAQADLDSARSRLSSAEADLDHARRSGAAAPPDAPPVDLGPMQRAVSLADGDVQEAQRALSAARTLCTNAEDDRDEAARIAIAAIEDVEDSGDLNDGWWDNTGAKIVEQIAKYAGLVAAIAGVAALLVGWIPVIGQALAAVLGTIALVAALVSLLANLSLASTGYGSWTNVVLDVVSLATFGIGRAVVGGARAAYRGAQATARLNAGRLAANATNLRAVGLGGASSRGGIRTLVGNGQVARLSRTQARNALAASRATPSFSWRTPFTSAWDDLRGLPGNLGTFNPSSLASAWRQTPGALGDLTRSRSFTEVMSRLTQNEAALRHLDFAAGVNPAVRHGDEFARAMNLTQVQVGATTVGASVDTYQLVGAVAGSESPAAAELNLPSEPGFAGAR